MYFSDVSGGGSSLTQKLRITNTGTANLVINSLGFSSGEWALGGTFNTPATISPGSFLDVPLVFKASAIGIRTGNLTINSNDTSTPTKQINLRGLGTAGEGGNLEPSLQRIFDLYQMPVNVGDPTPDTTDYPAPPTSGESIDIQKLVKAGAGNVTIEVLANFANSVSPSSRFGYYSPGDLATRTQLFNRRPIFGAGRAPGDGRLAELQPGGRVRHLRRVPRVRRSHRRERKISQHLGNRRRPPTESPLLPAQEHRRQRGPERLRFHVRGIQQRVRPERSRRHHPQREDSDRQRAGDRHDQSRHRADARSTRHEPHPRHAGG